MVSRLLFTGLVGAVAAQRLLEVRTSRRHERALLDRGGRRVADALGAMKALHAGWLASSLVEVWAGHPRPRLRTAVPALAAFAAGQALRRAARRALGPRWTVGIVVVPGETVVARGPYRRLRHPNYLGVALEIASLPLVGGARRTAVVFSVLNALVLARRIRAEERTLAEATDWALALGDRPRLLPRRLPARAGRA